MNIPLHKCISVCNFLNEYIFSIVHLTRRYFKKTKPNVAFGAKINKTWF